MLSRYTLRGQRRTSRRNGEAGPEYVDRIRSPILLGLLAVFVFQVLDAVFTLAHIARGGSELNPLMDILIQQSSSLFLSVKLGLAGFGLFFLGLHQNFPAVRHAVASLTLIFGGIVGYHLFLILVAS